MNYIQFVCFSVFIQKILVWKLDHFQEEEEYIMCYIEPRYWVTLKEINYWTRTEQPLLASETFIEQNVVVQILLFCNKEPDSST